MTNKQMSAALVNPPREVEPPRIRNRRGLRAALRMLEVAGNPGPVAHLVARVDECISHARTPRAAFRLRALALHLHEVA